jgi:hypothetical protein
MFESIGKLFDFRTMWNRQSLSPALERQVTLIAEKVFGVIIAPQGGFQNVTEWCKKEICWQRVRDLRVAFVPEFGKELVDLEEDAIAKKAGTKDQALLSSIEMQAMVIELGPAYWRAAQVFGTSRQLLSPDEDGIVGVAASMPRKLPTEKQCARLVLIKKRLDEEGFAGSAG